MLRSSFIINEVILGAHFRLFVGEFHKSPTLILKLFFSQFCLAVLYETLRGLVSGFIMITVPKTICLL